MDEHWAIGQGLVLKTDGFGVASRETSRYVRMEAVLGA